MRSVQWQEQTLVLAHVGLDSDIAPTECNLVLDHAEIPVGDKHLRMLRFGGLAEDRKYLRVALPRHDDVIRLDDAGLLCRDRGPIVAHELGVIEGDVSDDGHGSVSDIRGIPSAAEP